jgi:prophage tail gpP-like protein
MDDKIKIISNNNLFKSITDASISRSIDAVAGGFQITVTNYSIDTLLLKEDDPIKVFIGEEVYVTGWIERIESEYSDGNHNVVIYGSDKTVDIVEGSIYVNASYNLTSFKKLCEKVLADHDININVIDLSKSKGNDFPADEVNVGEAGESILDFLNRYAIKANSMLTTNGNGELVIYRNSGLNVGAKLNVIRFGNNSQVKSVKLIKDHSNRYSKVIIKSQLEDLDNDGDDVEGIAEDLKVTRKRVKVLISESIADINTANKIAEWEVNKRRSDSIQYNCNVVGFRTDVSYGKIWQPNFLVDINDEFSGIRATMMVKEVNFNYSESGTTTDLVLVSSDSYTLETQAKKLSIGVQ